MLAAYGIRTVLLQAKKEEVAEWPGTQRIKQHPKRELGLHALTRLLALLHHACISAMM